MQERTIPRTIPGHGRKAIDRGWSAFILSVSVRDLCAVYQCQIALLKIVFAGRISNMRDQRLLLRASETPKMLESAYICLIEVRNQTAVAASSIITLPIWRIRYTKPIAMATMCRDESFRSFRSWNAHPR